MPLKRPKGDALIEALAERTGYVFISLELAQLALSHASVSKPGIASNERLEFLGDRVLGLTIAEWLYELFPDAPQGELATRLNALVRAEACAAVGVRIDLLPLIRAHSGVKAQSGRNENKLLADAVEALIAAIHLDGGIEAAKTFILRFWDAGATADLDAIRDPKTVLQEFSVRHAKAMPVYVMESVEGPDHEPVFTVRLEIDGFAPVRASGRSKQGAQSQAAELFLKREAVILPAGRFAGRPE